MSKILDDIKKEHIKLYGEPCEVCEMYRNYCRCESLRLYVEKIKKDNEFPK